MNSFSSDGEVLGGSCRLMIDWGGAGTRLAPGAQLTPKFVLRCDPAGPRPPLVRIRLDRFDRLETPPGWTETPELQRHGDGGVWYFHVPLTIQPRTPPVGTADYLTTICVDILSDDCTAWRSFRQEIRFSVDGADRNRPMKITVGDGAFVQVRSEAEISEIVGGKDSRIAIFGNRREDAGSREISWEEMRRDTPREPTLPHLAHAVSSSPTVQEIALSRVQGETVPQEFHLLAMNSVLVGRDKDCDINYPYHGPDGQSPENICIENSGMDCVSRRHFQIRTEREGLYVVRQYTKNGLTVRSGDSAVRLEREAEHLIPWDSLDGHELVPGAGGLRLRMLRRVENPTESATPAHYAAVFAAPTSCAQHHLPDGCDGVQIDRIRELPGGKTDPFANRVRYFLLYGALNFGERGTLCTHGGTCARIHHGAGEFLLECVREPVWLDAEDGGRPVRLKLAHGQIVPLAVGQEIRFGSAGPFLRVTDPHPERGPVPVATGQ